MISIKKFFSSNKKIVMIVAGLILIAGITVGALIFFKSSPMFYNDKANIAAGNDLKSRGIEAQKKNDDSTARALFKQAKERYEAADDTNNVVDTNALIYLLEHK